MINLIKWLLIIIGAIATYYAVSLQIKYDGLTSSVFQELKKHNFELPSNISRQSAIDIVQKVIEFNDKNDGIVTKIFNEINHPKLHPEAMNKVYIPMINTLLDTGDIAMASIVRVKVADDVSNADVEEAMESIATAEGIRSVGMLPLSEMVELQIGNKQRFLKVYQYCSPRIAMNMIDYSDAFSAYLPCRLALIEDKQGQRWIYTLNMNPMIYGGVPLPDNLLEKALMVQKMITAIQNGGAKGDF